MPVEIREMVVKAIVPQQEGGPMGAAEGAATQPYAQVDHGRVVEECVAAVLKILEKRDRR